MLSPLYMAEISAPEVRGSLLALEQFSIVLGVIFGFWTGFFTRESKWPCGFYPYVCLILFQVSGSLSWRIPLGIQLIPGVVLAIGCFFLPPSPRLSVLQGDYDDAVTSLAKLRLRTQEEARGDPLIQVASEIGYLPNSTYLVHRSNF